ncbi:helix-turn-helix transcriptional regulator [Aestuariimicrobium ganziense]|uniref:helix-turn-helix transcriptional regulator n=1 Tax=Aestuariimicrobium ganziense TaxID=2773677 RepID=UPI001942D878|nr:hypothetical protein [Aestuariimicrobium ganziense]
MSNGPSRTPSGNDAAQLTPAKLRVLAAVDHLGPEVSIATLADSLGGHPNATRHSLNALVQADLLRVDLVSSGVGRPAQSFTITDAGRRHLAHQVTDTAQAELLEAVTRSLADLPEGINVARTIGREWGRGRHDLGSGLVEGLTQLGFAPRPGQQPGEIRLLACPLLEMAHRHPEVVCAMHQGMIDTVLEPGQSADLLPFAEPDACLMKVHEA